MPLVNFSNIDFDQIKVSIRDYLKANSNFTDYDFEGSNLSTIIDTLAYNTYISSYNANMVTNEVFIECYPKREYRLSGKEYRVRTQVSKGSNSNYFL